MSVPAEETGEELEPRTSPASGVTIQRVPWSVLGPEFATVWGRADPANPEPEHVEIIGMSGSGKTYLLLKILQDRMLVRNSYITLVVTKRADKIFARLGWPIVREVRDIRKYRQCIYWPQTNLIGRARRAYHEVRIREFLTRYWQPESNRVVAFDEIAYIESLSPEVRDLLQMWLREGRSNGLTVVMQKQRPQGVQRDMHSETQWTFAFVPKDRNDAERFAELFGSKRDWLPIFDQMNPDNHEFLVRHTRTRAAFISYVDEPVRPIKPPDNQRGGMALLRQRSSTGSEQESPKAKLGTNVLLTHVDELFKTVVSCDTPWRGGVYEKMGYVVIWDDPRFPSIQENALGGSLDDAFITVTRHHLEAIKDHLTALERLVRDVSG